MNGNGKARRVGIWIGLPTIAATAGAMYLNLANQTSVAIEVAKQHGQEILAVEKMIQELRGEIRSLRVATDDRFRGSDARAMEDRIDKQFRSLERRLERLEDR